MFVSIYPSSDIIIPDPDALAVEFPKIEFTLYSICIPTIEGNTLAATPIAVSEYSVKDIAVALTWLELGCVLRVDTL